MSSQYAYKVLKKAKRKLEGEDKRQLKMRKQAE